MKDMKSIFSNYLKNAEWSLLFLETLLASLIFILIDYFFDNHLPQFLESLHFPYIGFVMLIISIYSFYRLTFKSINLIVILGNAMSWIYIAINYIFDIFNPERPILGSSILIGVLAIIICIRILVSAYDIDLPKKQKR